PQTLVGFENHSGLTYLQGNTKPLGKVIVGNGNNGKDGFEGGRYKNVFGTYLHGSLLPKNPHFADYLISLALEKRYGEKIELTPLDDTLEWEAHNSVIRKPY
ncbi:MAG: glutamine amidotransferase, partial [Cyanobacteriota bacterium]|nr:glutamine amidotransferase [Cyanobacteriota bacterium]